MINTINGLTEARIGVGQAPFGITVTPSGRYAFVANVKSDEITILDLQSLQRRMISLRGEELQSRLGSIFQAALGIDQPRRTQHGLCAC